MTKRFAFLVVMTLVASMLLAHGAGHKKLLGTVKSLEKDHLVVVTKDKKEVTVHLTRKTKLTRGASSAKRADLKPGTRVSIEMESDGKTAVAITLSPLAAEKAN